jgi:hypothetical protein
MDTKQRLIGLDALVAAGVGFLFGLVLHIVTVYFRDHGPTGTVYTLRGNGAIVFLLLAPVALLIGEVLYARRRRWLAMVLLPIGMFLGLFVVLGGV